ncbi:HoxN/HupN/NixA family nickel/cobalt transporter [Rhizobium mesoamericanum]|uniref:Nickel/cobalt efflux system n=1 Tax=Rhizobium mesoamericanum STM3625 TaxID=1211777 RepID=K0Q282_9HYPH|nr:HoxN/HupN/NixA family nickel/cobalt transporter [Rhizobium mesoamericanum]CCM78545.1 High-affinity nickel transport protein [Rhizobium mesoamericanum STM3625]
MIANPFDDRPSQVKAKALFILLFLIAANVAVWVWTWVAFADHSVLLGTALIAYMLGLRHAFDADHIAAIDNVVRKLMYKGKRPLTVGFFFSLGHASVVVLASVALAATSSAMQSRLDDLHKIGGVIGTTVSALFLLVIGIANLIIFRGIWVAFLRARRGEKIIDAELDAFLAGGGLLARMFRRTFEMVSESWHIYPIGLLFGLGFDTATEIGLLGISATQAMQGMSLWTILLFPALFTAAMSLMDTVDSILMTGAYGWAFGNPIRKIWYNLTITGASVLVALFIGGLQALGLIGEKLGLQGGLWDVVGGFNDNLRNFGFAAIGIFVASWFISAIVYRLKNYDSLQRDLS